MIQMINSISAIAQKMYPDSKGKGFPSITALMHVSSDILEIFLFIINLLEWFQSQHTQTSSLKLGYHTLDGDVFPCFIQLYDSEN